MARLSSKDTIAAVATPPGRGGVAMVRISGPRARDIGLTLFTATDPAFTDFAPRYLHHGRFAAPGGPALDTGLMAFMPGPHSYTGEDVVECFCHGGNAAPAAMLEAILGLGARLAERGEFTKRAFLNGRMDLTQAEAVAELIHAPTKAGLHLAQAKLSGVLGDRLAELRANLEVLRAKLCLAVDFPEEDLDCLPTEELLASVDVARETLTRLLAQADRAKAWREGAMAVLAGRVNAGKSSLLNALIGRNRAIVTDLPGTTRDYLEEYADLDGLLVRLVDTAGLRATDDVVERAGVDMSRELMDRADLVLLVVDGSAPLSDEDFQTAKSVDPNRLLAVINKADLSPAHGLDSLPENGFDTTFVSAKTGQGLEELAVRIRERITADSPEPDPDEAVPNLRQAKSLSNALAELDALAQDAQTGVPHDLMSVRLEAACAEVDALTGHIAPDDVLNAIFEDFCIGK